MKSVLDNLKPSDIRRKPFPYLVIENALPERLYEELAETFPNAEGFAAEDATAVRKTEFISAPRVAASASIPAIWKEFFEQHTARGFAERVLEVFHDDVANLYPEFLSSWPAQTVGVRGRGDYDFVTDCQFVATRPARRLEIVPPHLDKPLELYAALLYFRHPDDRSEGADLGIYTADPSHLLFGKERIKRRYIQQVETVPYAANTLVMFINSPVSFHGLSMRRKAKHRRQHVNIIGETQSFLFNPLTRRDRRFMTKVSVKLQRYLGRNV